MRLRHSIPLLIPLLAASVAFASPKLQSIAEIERFFASSPQPNHDFILSGIITHLSSDDANKFCSFVLADGDERILIFNCPTNALTAGDVITVRGVVSVNSAQEPWMNCWQVTKTGHVEPPPTIELPLAETLEATARLRVIRTRATVVDVVRDEIDPKYDYLVLKDKGLTAFAACPHREGSVRLTDATVELTGLVQHHAYGQRKFLGTCICLDSPDDLRVISPPPADPFAYPPLERRIYVNPSEVAALSRRTVRGTVLAVWSGRNLLLQTDDGRRTKIELTSDEPTVACGNRVLAAGYPATDPYRINLERARIKILENSSVGDEAGRNASARELLHDKSGQRRYNDNLFGELVTLCGIVRSIQTEAEVPQRILLDCDSLFVPVDVSGTPIASSEIPIGSKLSVTGRCLLEIDNQRHGNLFPQIKSLTIVTRKPDDVVILSLPSWWTPVRLTVVIGVILTVLAGAFTWVFALHRLAERRGQALYRARQARDAERHTRELAEVRMRDRTRLAVELHDTISQNLTGASMQLGTAAQLVETDRTQAVRHLDIATRTLVSCREELRNCIWDLRNNALDEPDLNEGIRTTIHRLMRGVDLQIRFNIPREKLSDNTVHALMRIVRELATNAVRHGEAKNIRIAGALDGKRLRFSVTDDGKGFDPENRPGLTEGHFGLQGVEERVAEIGGEMKITSKIGKGTRVAIWIRSEC